VVSLYINDPAAEDVRPTKDLDISLEIVSFAALENLRLALLEKGFLQSAEDDVICRFRYEEIKVDVMSTKAVGWAPSNPWFSPGFNLRENVIIENQQIHILPLPYFLASKFTAFNNRGANDPRTSHDFEDIVYVMDNRTDLVEQLLGSRSDVMSYLKQQLQSILEDSVKQEAVYGNLFYETREGRYQRIIEMIKKLIS
jgi:predicted nucleotidyltransferase